MVKPGQAFNEGDILCMVETDKAVVAFETLEAGVMSKITQDAGNDIKVGQLIGWMVEEGEDWEIEVPDQEEEAAIPSTANSESAPNVSEMLNPSAVSSSENTSKSADLHDQVPSVRLLEMVLEIVSTFLKLFKKRFFVPFWCLF